MTRAKQVRGVGRLPTRADTAALCEIVSRRVNAPLEASQELGVFGATSAGLHLLITSRAERVYACVTYPGRENTVSTGRALGWFALGTLAVTLALLYFDEPQAGAVAACFAFLSFGGAWLARRTLREADRAAEAILSDVDELLRG